MTLSPMQQLAVCNMQHKAIQKKKEELSCNVTSLITYSQSLFSVGQNKPTVKENLEHLGFFLTKNGCRNWFENVLFSDNMVMDQDMVTALQYELACRIRCMVEEY